MGTALPLLGIFPKILGIWGSTWDLWILPCNLGIFLIVVKLICIQSVSYGAAAMFCVHILVLIGLQCTKIDRLILRKIIKIVATRCHI